MMLTMMFAMMMYIVMHISVVVLLMILAILPTMVVEYGVEYTACYATRCILVYTHIYGVVHVGACVDANAVDYAIGCCVCYDSGYGIWCRISCCICYYVFWYIRLYMLRNVIFTMVLTTVSGMAASYYVEHGVVYYVGCVGFVVEYTVG